jgi:hypothetical protein
MDVGHQNRQALLTAIIDDVSPFMQDDTLCDRHNPEAKVTNVASKLLLSTLFKKWRDTNERAETRALLTFLEANHLSTKWVLPTPLDDLQSSMWSELKSEMDRFWHKGPDLLVNSYTDLWTNGGVGPGAARGASGDSFYAKFGSSLLTATSLSLYTLYRRCIRDNPTWEDLEQVRESHYGSIGVVDGSQVSFAPKNVDTARLICTEPSLNMWYQLGLKTLIENRMSELWNVRSDVQPDLNRLMARIGSRDGSYGTLDLASASDSVSVELVKQLVPEWAFRLIQDIRSPMTHIRDYGLAVELGCVSTMGNGFTFPLMTCILSCAVRAVYRVLGLPIRGNSRTEQYRYNVPGNWAVFGDDILVSREAYDHVVAFLQLLGFQVNITKSFNEGPFRESCGHDYFRGTNIRGVYFQKLRTRQDLTIAVNRLNDWSARTGVPLRNAVKTLLALLKGRENYVPYADPDDAGIRVPSLIFSGKRRFQKAFYQSMVARPSRVRIADGVVKVPRGSKRMVYNGAAALLSLLHGELRDGCISVRQNQLPSTYQTRQRVTPFWDYMPASVWVNPRTDWPRWESSTMINVLGTYLEDEPSHDAHVKQYLEHIFTPGAFPRVV